MKWLKRFDGPVRVRVEERGEFILKYPLCPRELVDSITVRWQRTVTTHRKWYRRERLLGRRYHCDVTVVSDEGNYSQRYTLDCTDLATLKREIVTRTAERAMLTRIVNHLISPLRPAA